MRHGKTCCTLLEIFGNSVIRNVRYTRYLRNGDSKGHQTVNEAKPHEDHIQIDKLECIGNLQKRMGTRLRKLKRKTKSKNYGMERFLGNGIGLPTPK